MWFDFFTLMWNAAPAMRNSNLQVCIFFPFHDCIFIFFIFLHFLPLSKLRLHFLPLSCLPWVLMMGGLTFVKALGLDCTLNLTKFLNLNRKANQTFTWLSNNGVLRVQAEISNASWITKSICEVTKKSFLLPVLSAFILSFSTLIRGFLENMVRCQSQAKVIKGLDNSSL